MAVGSVGHGVGKGVGIDAVVVVADVDHCCFHFRITFSKRKMKEKKKIIFFAPRKKFGFWRVSHFFFGGHFDLIRKIMVTRIAAC